MKHMDSNDFFEPDEPLDDVIRAFNDGVKGLTGMPEGARLILTPPTFTYAVTERPKVAGLSVLPQLPVTA